MNENRSGAIGTCSRSHCAGALHIRAHFGQPKPSDRQRQIRVVHGKGLLPRSSCPLIAPDSEFDSTRAFSQANIAEYHVPVNADIHEIRVIFVDELDDSNPLGVKGLGEIGIVGVAAAIANAVYHATGKRVRDLPITLDKLQL